MSPTATWAGTTVQAAAQAFDGKYAVGLQWQVEPHTSTTPTAVDLKDDAELSVAYGGAQASRDCNDTLEVAVLVTLTTSASGLAESGSGTLRVSRSSQGLTASLRYEGQRISLDAELPEPASGRAPSVSIDALDPDLPGAFARFTQEP